MSNLEPLIHDYGREIFARLDQAGPLPFSGGWWDERLMEATMSQPAVKVQLFRFMDVLPQLRADGEINRHLREYFTEAADQLPGSGCTGCRPTASRDGCWRGPRGGMRSGWRGGSLPAPTYRRPWTPSRRCAAARWPSPWTASARRRSPRGRRCSRSGIIST
jgi:hypothetical protein